jgi:tyrosine-protein kinase Etk/Wzc
MASVVGPDSQIAAQAVEPTFLDLLIALGEQKRVVLMGLVGGMLIGLALAFALPPVFTAKTVLLPPQGGQSASSSLSASLGALAASAGVAAALRTPEELYVGLLRSDTVANAVIDRFKLRDLYGKSTLLDTRNELARRSRISADRKSSLLYVEVDDNNPEIAARIANGYAQELRQLLTRIAVTDAQQRRLFFELQVQKSKQDLTRAEIAAKSAQDKSGVVSLDAQTQGAISTAAQLRAQIVAREVQLRSMRSYAGPENPELRRVVSELGSLRAQLLKLESGGADGVAPGSSEGLENVRIFRELKYQEAIYSAMLQQFQLARADEAREAPLIQQVDIATPPDKKSKPARILLLAICMGLGLALGVAVALWRSAVLRAEAGASTRWAALRDAWALRRRAG